jgi:hypothetical protein
MYALLPDDGDGFGFKSIEFFRKLRFRVLAIYQGPRRSLLVDDLEEHHAICRKYG